MACCALAVFILGQLYMALEAVARALGLAPVQVDRTTATDWRLGAASSTIVARFWLRLPPFGGRLAFAGALSIAALGVALVFHPGRPGFDIAAYLADPAHICGIAGLVRF